MCSLKTTSPSIGTPKLIKVNGSILKLPIGSTFCSFVLLFVHIYFEVLTIDVTRRARDFP